METYNGFVRTPTDAIKLFEACRLGLLPRVQRRLSEKERQSIRSGSVFVWDEREAGMRRWTDGKSWSASRVSGSFLTYREMEGKRSSGFTNSRRGPTKTPESGRGSDEDPDQFVPEGYRYKADGLIKQSFSITTSAGQHLHLIAYYSRPHPGDPEMIQPSTDPSLRHITPVKGMYPESSLHEGNPTPALTRAPMVQQALHTIPQHHPHHPQHAQQPQQSQHPHPPHSHPQHQHPHQSHGPGYPSQPYPVQYGHASGYQWPPSPVATPPYNHHYTSAPYPPHGQQQPQPPQPAPPSDHPQTTAQHSSSQPSHYPSSHAASYDRVPLPPPQPQQNGPPGSSYQHTAPLQAPHTQAQAPRDCSPRSQHLQAQAAQAVMMDPPSGSANDSPKHNALPPLARDSLGPSGSHTPSTRTLSASPPQRHPDANGMASSNGIPSSNHTNKASLSALLHPPESTGPISNGASGGNGSPGMGQFRGMNVPPDRAGRESSHDARALSMLDSKFCI